MSRLQRKPNRLIKEKSPYLLQHAYNPVEWYPWGEEAFEIAERENKPIFLSIGYSTCHWCHVMEKESFEDQEVAELLNSTFVCIKVDREERPDIDSAFMKVCQALTGSGGWPLTIIMTPDKKPFFAATYIPKESRFGRTGLKEIVLRIKELWQNQRDYLEELAEKVSLGLSLAEEQAGGELSQNVIDTAYEQLYQSFDSKNGGFGRAPKFPSAHNLLFLLRYWRRKGEDRALEMVEKTLLAMRRGGIYDHIGFGFHRYSTDEKWLLPHFEKMLYDQATLALAYTEAYQATKKEEYKRTAEEIFTYVQREMTSQEGAFYSAQDADSEGEEGKFYLWSEEEIREVLGGEAELVIKVFNVREEGNFREEVTGIKTGKNILHLKKPLKEIAAELGVKEEELRRKVEEARKNLLRAREKRIPPAKDDKILVDWNGLMIAALAKAAQVFDEPEYAEAAKRASDFILERMLIDGKLYHRYREGEAAIDAFLDDYAFLTFGLLELYEATFDVRYLRKALELTDYLLENFWEHARGGFYFTQKGSQELPLRRKELQDTAYPSGNSVAFLNLLRLSKITGKAEYEERAWALGESFSREVEKIPVAYTFFLSALIFAFSSSLVVIAGNKRSKDTIAMIKALRENFLPNKVLLLSSDEELSDIAEFTGELKSIGGRATAYICRDYSCSPPTTSIEEMLERLLSF